MIGKEQLRAAIRQVAASKPDYVYQKGDDIIGVCSYTPNDSNTCGCIVGEALFSLGIHGELLHALDARNRPVPWSSGRVIDVLEGLVSLDALQDPWVIMVQHKQDNGMSWADAVRVTDEHFKVAA